MRHQPFKHYLVVGVEKDASEPVFGFLDETFKNVFLNPDEEIFGRYIQNLDEVMIVKNLVSEAPLTEVQKIVVPALEKLFVDMLADTNLFSAQQNETEFIMKSAMDKFAINELKMKRYALRRNREKEVEKLINIRLVRIPPYAPELNPAEKVWQWMKDKVAMKFFNSTQSLQNKITEMVHQLTPSLIKSITGYNFYTDEFIGKMCS